MAIDDQEINTEADLFKILESRQPGDVIAITAQRWRVVGVGGVYDGWCRLRQCCGNTVLAGSLRGPIGVVPK